jgi:Ser/Thr protein kinase RdoA (MazF antagonist)
LHRWGEDVAPDDVAPQSGTANAGAVIAAPGGRLFLKRRNPRYAREDWVRFDHALLQHLAADGLPVPRPLAAETGESWVVEGEDIYELFRFIEGSAHRPGNALELRSAGEMLGRIHRSTERFEPPVAKPWERFHDPQQARRWLADLLEMNDCDAPPGARDTLRMALELADALAERLPDDAYWRLPRTIVQADYHPANLKFRDGQVAGVFDWDWASDQPRMVDLADGLLFFCGRRDSPLAGGDVWSLSEAFDIDAERVAQFGEAYLSAIQPRPEELAALPDLMRARWLYSRADGARRKVEAGRRVEFVTRELARPLDGIDRLEPKLIDGSALRT